MVRRATKPNNEAAEEKFVPNEDQIPLKPQGARAVAHLPCWINDTFAPAIERINVTMPGGSANESAKRLSQGWSMEVALRHLVEEAEEKFSVAEARQRPWLWAFKRFIQCRVSFMNFAGRLLAYSLGGVVYAFLAWPIVEIALRVVLGQQQVAEYSKGILATLLVAGLLMGGRSAVRRRIEPFD